MLKLQITDTGRAPAWLADFSVPSQSWHDPAGNLSACVYCHQGACWVDVPGCARFYFDREDTVVAFSAYGASIETIEDVYRHSVLPVALQERGLEVLHASAVRFPEGVVAFCAESETGKSTIAYGLSRRGYSIWGDDAVAFAASESNVQAIPLPFEIHLRPAPAAFFGSVPARDVEERFPGISLGPTLNRGTFPAVSPMVTNRLPDERAPIVAVCMLRRQARTASGLPVQITRLSPTRAFTALLPHAYCFSLHDRERNRQMMQQYLELSARVPVFDVYLQTGLDHLAMALDGIVESIAGVV